MLSQHPQGVALCATNRLIGLSSLGGEDAAGYSMVAECFERASAMIIGGDVAKTVADQFWEYYMSPNVGIRTVFRVQNFSAPEEFELDDEVTFRPITQDDIDKFGRVGPFTYLGDQPRLDPLDWICDVRHAGAKDSWEAINRHRHLVEQTAGALGLATEGRATFDLLANEAELSFGVESTRLWYGRAIPTSRLGGKLTLHPERVEVFKAIYKKLKLIDKRT